MGWLDYHLHELETIGPRSERVVRIGIPSGRMGGAPHARLFQGRAPLRYTYDFGDDWRHTVEAEEIVPADEGSYPRCVDGAAACPPEDVCRLASPAVDTNGSRAGRA